MGDKTLFRHRKQWISPDSQPFNKDNIASRAHHLIIVAGHSVIISGDLEDANIDEEDWYLLDYQIGQGLPQAIVEHIKAGIEECDKDKDSLLIFSGGETRAVTGPLTEGSSYFHVADAMNLWSKTSTTSTVRSRATTEEYATDSFQNLLFSICRFHEVTGSYPTKITVVGFTFKKRRFEELHAKALRWPTSKYTKQQEEESDTNTADSDSDKNDNNSTATFNYIGIDEPATSTKTKTKFDLEKATKGEYENAVKLFEIDPYGCHSAVLQKKRMDRNPFSRTPPYELTCPDMKELLNYCGPELISDSLVPWGGRSTE